MQVSCEVCRLLVAFARALSRWCKFTASYIAFFHWCPQTMQFDTKKRQHSTWPSYSKVLVCAASTASPWHFSHNELMVAMASLGLSDYLRTDIVARDISCPASLLCRLSSRVQFTRSNSEWLEDIPAIAGSHKSFEAPNIRYRFPMLPWH